MEAVISSLTLFKLLVYNDHYLSDFKRLRARGEAGFRQLAGLGEEPVTASCCTAISFFLLIQFLLNLFILLEALLPLRLHFYELAN